MGNHHIPHPLGYYLPITLITTHGWNYSFRDCFRTYPSNTFWLIRDGLPSVPSWWSIKPLIALLQMGSSSHRRGQMYGSLWPEQWCPSIGTRLTSLPHSIILIFRLCRDSSVGRAEDWKSLCHQFKSGSWHFSYSNMYILSTHFERLVHKFTPWRSSTHRLCYKYINRVLFTNLRPVNKISYV